MIETNENYWDCECEEDYIHEKAKKKYLDMMAKYDTLDTELCTWNEIEDE